MYGLDLFSGAGGMSLGASWSGVDVKLAVDYDYHSLKTYSQNHPDTMCIRTEVTRDFNVFWPYPSSQTVLFGGPPCQGFSTSNQRTRNKGNEKNWLFEAFLSVVRQVKPQWVVFENVKGILETESGYFVDEIKRQFSELGYSFVDGVLCAADFGVPQKRNRYFLVACRGHVDLKLPISSNQCEQVTVHDAIHDLPSLKIGSSACQLPYKSAAESSYAKKMRKNASISHNNLVTRSSELIQNRYKSVPQGGNWQDIPDHLMDNYSDKSRCHTGIYHRLTNAEPSVVIGNFRKNMLIHPTEDRGLSVREAARLQSFPDHYRFHGSIGFQQQQVGNAVPPLLAKAVFDTILNSIRDITPEQSSGQIAAE